MVSQAAIARKALAREDRLPDQLQQGCFNMVHHPIHSTPMDNTHNSRNLHSSLAITEAILREELLKAQEIISLLNLGKN